MSSFNFLIYFFKRLYGDIISLVALLVTFYMFWNVPELAVDLNLDDEASYSLVGELYPRITPLSNWAPLYSMWHYLLLFVEPNRIATYNLNVRLTTIIPILFLYLSLRILSVPQLGALTLCSSLLLSVGVLLETPRVNLFAASIVGLFVCLLSRKGKESWFLVSLVLLFGSYMRPEYFFFYITDIFC